MRWYGIGAICRADEDLVYSVVSEKNRAALVMTSVVTVWLGSMAYGTVFGSWRGPQQAMYASVKLPLLIFSVTSAGALINAMLSQILGAKLGFRQIWICMLIGLSIASALLGAFSPVFALFLAQVPDNIQGAAEISRTYWSLLLCMTGGIGAAGLTGFSVLFRFLRTITGSRQLAARMLAIWVAVTGFTGTQISWLLSPFICRPDFDVTFLNPQAFESNFYEQVWAALLAVIQSS